MRQLDSCTRCNKIVDDEKYKRCTKCRDRLLDYYNKRGRMLRGYSNPKKYRGLRRNSDGRLELQCTRCGQFKDQTGFSVSRCHRHGRKTWCKECVNEAGPKYEERVRRAVARGMTERDARYWCSKFCKRWPARYLSNHFKLKNTNLFVRAVAA